MKDSKEKQTKNKKLNKKKENFGQIEKKIIKKIKILTKNENFDKKNENLKKW